MFLCSFFDIDELLFIPILFFITSKNISINNNIICCGYPKMHDKYKQEEPFKQESSTTAYSIFNKNINLKENKQKFFFFFFL